MAVNVKDIVKYIKNGVYTESHLEDILFNELRAAYNEGYCDAKNDKRSKYKYIISTNSKMDINEVALRIFCAWQFSKIYVEQEFIENAYYLAERFMAEGRRRGYIEKEPAEPKKRYRIKTKEELISQYGMGWPIEFLEYEDFLGQSVIYNEKTKYFETTEGRMFVMSDLVTEIKDGE